MSKWKKYELLPNDEKLPNKPCVYAVYFDDELVYVGQSSSLLKRFRRHAFRYGYAKNIHTPWTEISSNTRVSIKVKFSEKLGDWAMWEIRLIKKLKPIFNRLFRNTSKD